MIVGRRQVALALALASVIAGAHATAESLPARGGWTKRPTITVVSEVGDPRIPLVREAVAFWNRTFAEIGTPFRLGDVTEIVGSVPGADLQALSDQVLSHAWPQNAPPSLSQIPGDLIVILSDANFVSFTAHEGPRVIVAIKSANAAPLTLANVARNVIAHELGHAVGLQHNADPTLLMCGRPAPCRPDIYQSDKPRIFSLSAQEISYLTALYPPNWRPR